MNKKLLDMGTKKVEHNNSFIKIASLKDVRTMGKKLVELTYGKKK